MDKPHPPQWAVAEQILAKPRPRQTLRSYWTEAGFTNQDVDRALEGLQHPDMANQRLGHELRMRYPDVFDVHVCARLLKARGRFHQI